jgi:hypothetical protein
LPYLRAHRFLKGPFMSTFSMELPHRCSSEAARACVDGTFAEVKTKYASYIGDIKATWQGDVASFTMVVVAPARVEIKGTVTVAAEIVTLAGEYTLPIFLRAMPVGPMVENAIRKAWTEKCSKCPTEKGTAKNA